MGYRKARFRHTDPLASMPWEAFEQLMARHYAARGYRVEHTGTGAQTSWRKFDGGIDLKLYRDGEYVVVQCKRESVFEVTHNVVHQLIGVMHTQHATRAIVVITGAFSSAAITAAAEFPQIELIDGVKLRRMLAETGDLPTTQWADDVLGSMAEESQRKDHTARSRRASRKATPMIWILKGILGIGVPLFVAYVLIPSILKNAASSIVPPSHPAPALRPEPLVTKPLPGASAHLSNVSSNPVTSPPSATTSAFTKLSKKEAAEWDKKNAESMRILEKTTPPLEQ